MLCLQCNTNPGWINAVKQNITATIIDHAHAEKKAAQTALNLINTYPEKTDLALELSELIIEEINHFKTVMELLNNRGVKLTKDTGDEYARQLFSNLRKEQPQRFLDHLLVAGIIEARSCERLKILENNIDDSELKKIYHELFPTEANHYRMFIDIAKKYFDKTEVEKRLFELSALECKIIKKLTDKPTMHG
jgi:tRNA-(ms[2]io[6]A)-hydroxylase